MREKSDGSKLKSYIAVGGHSSQGCDDDIEAVSAFVSDLPQFRGSGGHWRVQPTGPHIVRAAVG